jgi:hypothetical protein
MAIKRFRSRSLCQISSLYCKPRANGRWFCAVSDGQHDRNTWYPFIICGGIGDCWCPVIHVSTDFSPSWARVDVFAFYLEIFSAYFFIWLNGLFYFFHTPADGSSWSYKFSYQLTHINKYQKLYSLCSQRWYLVRPPHIFVLHSSSAPNSADACCRHVMLSAASCHSVWMYLGIQLY